MSMFARFKNNTILKQLPVLQCTPILLLVGVNKVLMEEADMAALKEVVGRTEQEEVVVSAC